VAPSSAKIGSFSETFSQCFFNEMNKPVFIQQVVRIIINFFYFAFVLMLLRYCFAYHNRKRRDIIIIPTKNSEI
jgi:hypothetical protein